VTVRSRDHSSWNCSSLY